MKQVFGAVVCFLIGSLLLFLANRERLKVGSLLAEGKTTTATVVDVTSHQSTDDDGKTTTFYTPVFAFRDDTGNPRKFKQHFSQGNTSTYDYGERVEVLYHPTDNLLFRDP